VWLKVAAQCFEGVAVAAGDGVDGFVERLRDLGEGEVAPDFQDNDFPLLLRQPGERGFDGFSVLALLDRRVETGRITAQHFDPLIGLAPHAAFVTAEQVQRARPHGGVEQWVMLGLRVGTMPPEAYERRLHDVLGIGLRANPLARIQHEPRRELLVAGTPRIGGKAVAGFSQGFCGGERHRVRFLCARRAEKSSAPAMRPAFLFLAVLTPLFASAGETLAGRADIPPSPALQELVDRAVAKAVADFTGRKLGAEQIAVTLLDLTDPAGVVRASHRGDVSIYPASVIKLFYLVAAHQWMQESKLADTPELRRAMRDMIVESSNDATSYIVDALTDTTSGPELSDDELRAWWEKRHAVQRYFGGLGYSGVTVTRKPWNEGPYGRETQAMKAFAPKSNQLTTDATARIVFEIATGKAVSADRSAQMMELMERDLTAPMKAPDNQTFGFTGRALIEPAVPGVKLWSKAGWTSQTRHDAALLELTDGRKFILVVFTTGHANERGIIPAVVRVVMEGLRR
jgi:hypothetical protein